MKYKKFAPTAAVAQINAALKRAAAQARRRAKAYGTEALITAVSPKDRTPARSS